MSAIIDRLKFLLGDQVLPDSHWKAFLDEVGTYSVGMERENCSLNASSQMLLSIIDVIPVAFFVKDHLSRFFLMNRACEEQWGMSFAELRGTDGHELFPPDQMRQFLDTDRLIFQGRQPIELEETFWSASRQSNRIGHTFKMPMYRENGDPQYLVCVTLDITEQKLAQAALADSERRLLELATTDFLTDLPNRRQLFARLADEFARVRRFDGQVSSVLVLDLDYFKLINDRHGHAGGDAVLKHFAGLMRSTIRAIDVPGRIGGEEFAIVLPGVSAAEARILAERLRRAVANTPAVQDGKPIALTVSIGIAAIDGADADADATLRRADEALYRAKRNGRNRVELAEVQAGHSDRAHVPAEPTIA
ncbi:MAG: GGDEF domain-containing protein [Betaproteobacteria bacterium]